MHAFSYPLTGGSWARDVVEVGPPPQGHYALLSSAYFGGSGTDTVIAEADVDTFLDLNLTVDANGVYDYRTQVMKDAQSSGHTGSGTSADPFSFNLEGLTTGDSCSLRAIFRFDPDEDGGRLDARAFLTKHSSAGDYAIEATSVAMESGAEIDYAQSPNIKFIITEDIDTHAEGDAGAVRFQVRSDVAGTVTLDEIALFI